MPDPVRITVSEVRREIHRAAGFTANSPTAAEASTPWLGTLFHEVFRRVMHPASLSHWSYVLDAGTLNEPDRLREHVWISIVGPKLRQNQAGLQASARAVLNFWTAVGHLCHYICQLLSNSLRLKTIRYDPVSGQWKGLDRFGLEEELIWTLAQPDWVAPVEVRGTVDAIWKNPGKQWCLLDLKLGKGSPEADLAQLCLYHAMAHPQDPGEGELMLFHFTPQRESSTLRGSQLSVVRSKLIDLIGSIAGVKADSQRPVPTQAHRVLGERLVQVLEQLGPVVALESDPVVGPTFLRFHIMPAPGVKVGRILPLGEDLGVQLRLNKPALIRLEGGMLLIDLERPDRQKLWFRDIREQLPPPSPTGNARMLVGVDLKGVTRFAELPSECPHVLAAGTTGSGKSEWLRTALASLILTNTPQTLRIMLIDPKRVTFHEVSRSPFLFEQSPALYTPEEAIEGLNRLRDVMEQRYVELSRHGCADLPELQRKAGTEAPPRIVCFCDEYGNLVAEKKNRERMEAAINQLGAKARAAGIHLIVATQDPRAQILSPTLKSNLGGRVCLKTTSATQSRMMLEESGAEALLGHGDLLFKTTGEPVRLQAPLLETEERQAIFAPRAAHG